MYQRLTSSLTEPSCQHEGFQWVVSGGGTMRKFHVMIIVARKILIHYIIASI